jgi:hypothetical protein
MKSLVVVESFAEATTTGCHALSKAMREGRSEEDAGQSRGGLSIGECGGSCAKPSHSAVEGISSERHPPAQAARPVLILFTRRLRLPAPRLSHSSGPLSIVHFLDILAHRRRQV